MSLSLRFVAFLLIFWNATFAWAGAPWRFAVVSDTHFDRNPTILPEIVQSVLGDNVQFILVCGDLVDGYSSLTTTPLQTQLMSWRDVMEPLYNHDIGVYPVRGNHVAYHPDVDTVWREVFSGRYALPDNGPPEEMGYTYSFRRNNALFIALDEHMTGHRHRLNEAWLDQTLADNTLPHVFVFGHEPAFKVHHTDCLGSYPTERNVFWSNLAHGGARVYFCGHDHVFDVARIDDGDGNVGNDLYQVIVGTGGGGWYTEPAYNGDNWPYVPRGVFHELPYGYLLVEIGGKGLSERVVTMRWKQRDCEPGTESYGYRVTSDVLRYTVPAPCAAASPSWSLY
jgi:hypothetical protein